MENIEINSIIESLTGIFDDQAEGIKKAQSDAARAGSTKSGHDVSLLDEFKKCDFEPGNPGESLMDLKNNHEGRRLFLKYGQGKDLSVEEVADIVRRAAGNGTLRTKPYEIRKEK
jgi:hypothetical protein